MCLPSIWTETSFRRASFAAMPEVDAIIGNREKRNGEILARIASGGAERVMVGGAVAAQTASDAPAVADTRRAGTRLSQIALAEKLRSEGYKVANNRLRWLAAVSGLEAGQDGEPDTRSSGGR